MANSTNDGSLLRRFAFKSAAVKLMLGALLTLAALIILQMSGTTLTQKAERGGPGSCIFSSDCESPLVCEGQLCRLPCRTSRDCSSGWLCLDTTPPARICADPRLITYLNEQNKNRPGGDYRQIPDGTLDEKFCRSLCEDDPDCISFTYVKPGIQALTAKCWLKKSAPDPVSDSCCTSGVVRRRPGYGVNAAPRVGVPVETPQ